jgi:hypothetical protein
MTVGGHFVRYEVMETMQVLIGIYAQEVTWLRLIVNIDVTIGRVMNEHIFIITVVSKYVLKLTDMIVLGSKTT